MGGDQWLRLFLPREGQSEPRLPTTTQWWPELCAMPEEQQPIVRNYTVRRARPELGELDIDLVRHGDGGPATRWAGRVRVGDRIGLLDQYRTYAPPADAPWHLLLGDEAALPAVAAIAEGLPARTTAVALVEVPSIEDAQEIESTAELTVHWLPRRPGARTGAALLSALRDGELPAGVPSVFLAGEQRTVRNARRLLVGPRGYPKESVCFMAYWRLGLGAGD